MIDIVTIKGEKYSFDPETERVYKNGFLLPTSEVEPVYSNVPNKTEEAPRFSGLFFKNSNSILSLSGKLNPVSDLNSII